MPAPQRSIAPIPDVSPRNGTLSLACSPPIAPLTGAAMTRKTVAEPHRSAEHGAPGKMRWLIALLVLLAPLAVQAQTFYVATDGDDNTGNGTLGSPWATITHALDSVSDGSTVLVRPGLYNGRVRLRGSFAQGVVVRSEQPYRAQLRHTSTVLTCFDGQGITLEGFDIAHSGPGAGALLMQIQDLIAGPDFTRRIVIRNNIFHDSYNNDLLKINNGAGEVRVEGNLFYNQEGSDEHMDINSVRDVLVEGNIMLNDFEGSGRPNNNDTSSYIVIKDSNGNDDGIEGSQDITVRRNVFLHWQGSTGSNFVLIGEDGNPFYEARDVLVENNLLLGDSDSVMRAPFGVKGGRDITFRHNTVLGDLPSLAYTMRLNTEGANPANLNISFYNNVWVDPTGSMGATGPGSNNDFSDTPPGDTTSFTLDRNLYWNGGSALPFDGSELVNYTDDSSRLESDPLLPLLDGVVLPRWVPASGQFADGSTTIEEAFERLVRGFGKPAFSSPMRNNARADQSPADDILGRPRSDGSPDLGALELIEAIFADNFESGDLLAWQ